MATRLIQFAIGLSILTFIVTQNLVSTLSVIVVAGALQISTPFFASLLFDARSAIGVPTASPHAPATTITDSVDTRFE